MQAETPNDDANQSNGNVNQPINDVDNAHQPINNHSNDNDANDAIIAVPRRSARIARRPAIIADIEALVKVLLAIAESVYPVNPGRIVLISEYRSSHIDAKDAIAFALIKIKNYYDQQYT